ncbi:hypothetical protein [Kitasatospora sp. NPDC006786]|uniref:hypothetical protein n=1 Tax=unclassified Kitasatospora TaxID=2633591 RepID=UPI0033C93D0E
MTTPANTPHTATPETIDPQITLLATGYSPAVLDGQILAVPLRPGTTDDTYVPAIIDGQVAAVPVYDPLAAPARPAALAPAAPVTAAQPAADPGLPLALRQGVLYGCAGLLAVGGVTWMVGAGVGEVAPYADQIGTILMWAAATVATVVIGVAALLGKLRSVAGAASGLSATTGSDGATATGPVLAMFHRHTEVTIGRQSAGWKGTVNNNVR